MSIEQSHAHSRGTTVLSEENNGVYGALFGKINLSPVKVLGEIEVFQNTEALSDVSVDERVTAAVSVFLKLIKQSSRKVRRLDRTLLDEHIASLDAQISRQLDAVMHHPDFQRVESTWRGVKSLIDQTDFRQNVRIELLDISKDHLVQDFEDAPEIAQSGLYMHTYTQEYDTPGGEAVRQRPYSVVLLDEVEKAHRDVLNLFYQVFDRGFMRDGEGREIDFRNTVILMTSNLGSDELQNGLREQPEARDSDLHEWLRPLLREHFQPALLARFQTLIYRPLLADALKHIVALKLAKVARRLHSHYGLTCQIEDGLHDALVAACLLPDTGARNIDSLLNQQILPVLSQQLLQRQAAKYKTLGVTLGFSEEEGITLQFTDGPSVVAPEGRA